MKEFFTKLVELKIPTILILALFFITGSYLVVSSTNSQSIFFTGIGILIVGVILALISFSDHRQNEQFANLIKHYETALKNISETHTRIEKNAQDVYSDKPTTIGTESDQYKLEKQQNTQTIT